MNKKQYKSRMNTLLLEEQSLKNKILSYQLQILMGEDNNEKNPTKG